MIASIALYTFHCFAVFKYTNEHDRRGIYFRQIIFMILIHFFGFLSLYCSTGEHIYIKAYIIEQIGILSVISIYRFVYPAANRLIINNMCMLLTIGLVILTRISYDKAMKQFAIAIGAVAVTLIVPFLITRITFFDKFKWLYVAVGTGSLLIVLLFSNLTYGSKINISIANYTFQPSEYVKIVFVFAISSILAYKSTIKEVILSGIVAMIHVLLLVISKDLGSAVIFFVVYLCMLFVATRNYLYFGLGLLGAGAGSVIGYKMFSHVRVRVLAFLDPLGHIEDAGYQIAQSLFAIGTGGFLGMGVGQGAPRTIPVVAADFIFSAICEEFGVFFGVCLILICASCFIMFMNIAMRFHDRFFKLVALGLGVAYGFQVFLTIGGVTKFIPLTGVTLPLVSYGGTSVVVTCFVFAIIQGLYIYKDRRKKIAEKKKAEEVKGNLEIFDDTINMPIEAVKEQRVRKRIEIEEDIKPIVKPKRQKKNNSNKNTIVDTDYGGIKMDTVMMDEAFRKAVEAGIDISDNLDFEVLDIEDID